MELPGRYDRSRRSITGLRGIGRKPKDKKARPGNLRDTLENWKAKHGQMLASWAWDREAMKAQQEKLINPQWLCYASSKWLPPDAMVVRETTSDAPAVTWHIRVTKPGNFYRGNMKGLGADMGVAFSVKLASPSQPVVHLVRDGAFNSAPVPDHAKFMKAFAGYGEKVENPHEIAPALDRACAECKKGAPPS